MSFDPNSYAYRMMRKFDERGWYDEAKKFADSIGFPYSPGEFAESTPLSTEEKEYMQNVQENFDEFLEQFEKKVKKVQEKLASISAKGKLIMIYAPSQMGKDFYTNLLKKIIKQKFYYMAQFQDDIGLDISGEESDYISHAMTWEQLDRLPEIIETKFAEVYKVRDKRKDDGDNLHAVSSEEEILANFDVVASTPVGQTVAYSSSQIKTDINSGKIVFASTTSTDVISKLKAICGEDLVVIKILGSAKSEEQIHETEIKRYGEDSEMVREQTKKRFESYKQNYDSYRGYTESDFAIINNKMITEMFFKYKDKVSNISEIAALICSGVEDEIVSTLKRKEFGGE